ncbi:hypothetical protein L7F22_038517 [Adiantum nelumboides]|nr:hypothetical protein [Adiantum nelumboides]
MAATAACYFSLSTTPAGKKNIIQAQSKRCYLEACSSEIKLFQGFQSGYKLRAYLVRRNTNSAVYRPVNSRPFTFKVKSQLEEDVTIDNSTVLVVGGGGTGMEVVRALAKAGSWVTAFLRGDKFRKEVEGLGAMLAIGDVMNPSTIEKVLKSNTFDAVVCTVGGGIKNTEVDKDGCINVMRGAKNAGVKRGRGSSTSAVRGGGRASTRAPTIYVRRGSGSGSSTTAITLEDVLLSRSTEPSESEFDDEGNIISEGDSGFPTHLDTCNDEEDTHHDSDREIDTST